MVLIHCFLLLKNRFKTMVVRKTIFSISSGCSTFNAYNASCNLTFTFCKGSSFMGGDNTLLVFDLINSRVVKEGQVEDAEDSKQILDGLPKGHYVVYINGTSTQYVKTD